MRESLVNNEFLLYAEMIVVIVLLPTILGLLLFGLGVHLKARRLRSLGKSILRTLGLLTLLSLVGLYAFFTFFNPVETKQDQRTWVAVDADRVVAALEYMTLSALFSAGCAFVLSYLPLIPQETRRTLRRIAVGAVILFVIGVVLQMLAT